MSKIVKERQDLTYLSWSVFRNSSGTAGSFLKSYSELGGRKIYYKLSNYDSERGITGHECVNEIIVDRLLTLLEVPHVSYQLIHGNILVGGKPMETYLCASEDFKKKGESKIALDVYKELEAAEGENVLDFCVRMGWEEEIYRLLAVDYLILNRDRHGANLEVLRSFRDKTLRLAPLFDHGVSLLCCCLDDSQAENFDVMADRPCNNYIGSRSTWANLKMIPKDFTPFPSSLRETDREYVLEGLEGVISPTLQNKIWEMIWKRWCAYEDFCSTR